MPRLEFSAFEYMLLSYTGKYTAYKFILFTNCTSLFWFNIKIRTHPLYKFLILNQNSYTELLLVNLYNEKYLTGISVVSFKRMYILFVCQFFINEIPYLRCFFVYVYVTKDKSCAFRKQADVYFELVNTWLFYIIITNLISYFDENIKKRIFKTSFIESFTKANR